MIGSENHPIIVLGVERSGTSVVAEMVHRWGAYAGPSEKLHKADVHAPRGYWEFLPLWDLLAELGDFDAGATWWDRDFQQQIEKKAADPASRKKAIELMAEMSKGGPWFWKDPALSHFLPFWKRIWTDAIYIITVRNPLRHSSIVAEVYYAIQCGSPYLFCRDEFAALAAHDDANPAAHRRRTAPTFLGL